MRRLESLVPAEALPAETATPGRFAIGCFHAIRDIHDSGRPQLAGAVIDDRIFSLEPAGFRDVLS